MKIIMISNKNFKFKRKKTNFGSSNVNKFGRKLDQFLFHEVRPQFCLSFSVLLSNRKPQLTSVELDVNKHILLALSRQPFRADNRSDKTEKQDKKQSNLRIVDSFLLLLLLSTSFYFTKSFKKEIETLGRKLFASKEIVTSE